MGDIGKPDFKGRVLFAPVDKLKKLLEADKPGTAQVVGAIDGAKPDGAEWAITKPDNRIQEWEFQRASADHQAAILEANQKLIQTCLENALANVRKGLEFLEPKLSNDGSVHYSLRRKAGSSFYELCGVRWNLRNQVPSQCTEARRLFEEFSAVMDAMDKRNEFTLDRTTAAAKALTKLEAELQKSLKSVATISPWSPK